MAESIISVVMVTDQGFSGRLAQRHDAHPATVHVIGRHRSASRRLNNRFRRRDDSDCRVKSFGVVNVVFTDGRVISVAPIVLTFTANLLHERK